jgi:hypothetical protein
MGFSINSVSFQHSSAERSQCPVPEWAWVESVRAAVPHLVVELARARLVAQQTLRVEQVVAVLPQDGRVVGELSVFVAGDDSVGL